jgi:large subunit ribosomal protein L5
MKKELPRLKNIYHTDILPALKESLNCTNDLQVPKISKITLNIGLGLDAKDSKILQFCFKQLELISGQKPIVTKARKSISAFKIRTGFPLGLKVTLRSYRMYEFLDRLINIVMPRIRDFKGISPSMFDNSGNFTIGIKEFTSFPEVDYDNVKRNYGLDVNIATTATSAIQARKLFELFGFPILNR